MIRRKGTCVLHVYTVVTDDNTFGNLACLACQTSHTFCNMERPCERCVKKNIECVDGCHKKAKYMMDEPEKPDQQFLPSCKSSDVHPLLSLPSHSGDDIRNVYSRVTKPYPYAQNFNNLLLYISKRLDKDSIFRVCRAISYFRPSLIAVIKNLTEEDLLLKEKCCQRMLLEYKRILLDSGDPR